MLHGAAKEEELNVNICPQLMPSYFPPTVCLQLIAESPGSQSISHDSKQSPRDKSLDHCENYTACEAFTGWNAVIGHDWNQTALIHSIPISRAVSSMAFSRGTAVTPKPSQSLWQQKLCTTLTGSSALAIGEYLKGSQESSIKAKPTYHYWHI